MTELKRRVIQNSARCILLRDNKVLLCELDDGHGRWWAFPGGRQEYGETLEECAVRECREELSCEVAVRKCLLVRELIADRLSGGIGDIKGCHFVEAFFLADTLTEPTFAPPVDCLTNIGWFDVDALESINCLPRFLAENLRHILTGDSQIPVYVANVE